MKPKPSSKEYGQSSKETARTKLSRIAAMVLSVTALAAIAACQPKQPAPQPSSAAVWHSHIVTTVFWAGERADSDNGYISNTSSAWDDHWQQHFGGVDSPDSRNGLLPATFKPKENPFYVALPYNDIAADGSRKPTAKDCHVWQPHPDKRYSYCKNIWVAIRYHGTTVYAQWEDAGPFGENDTPYVFGNAKPRNTTGERAGLDISPAVQADLGMKDVDNTSWRFVKATDVPTGPWSEIVTTSPGDSLY